jgi:hypothetical protein
MAVDLVGAGAGAKSHQRSHQVGAQNEGGSGVGAKSQQRSHWFGAQNKPFFLLHHLPIKEQLNN